MKYLKQYEAFNQLTNRERKYHGFINIDELDVKTRSGKDVKRQIMVRKNGVASVVWDTAKKKFIFVNQYRPGSNTEIVEIVAGTLDVEGEDKKEAMIREIGEEIGYETDRIELIDDCYMSPGGSSEVVYIYYAEVSKQVSKGGGLENEDIDIVEMSLDEVLNTKFKDAKTIIGVSYIKSNKEKFK